MSDTPDLDAIEAKPSPLITDAFGWESHADRKVLCASIRAKDAEIARLREDAKVCSRWIEGRLIEWGALKEWPTLLLAAKAILMRLGNTLKEQSHADAG